MSVTNRKRLFKLFLTLIVLALGVTMALPLAWMVSASLKPEADIFVSPIKWIPETLITTNYRDVWNSIIPFDMFYMNTIKVTVISTIGCVIISLLSAYAFARIDFTGKNVIFLLYIATLMFPNTMLLVPRLVIYRFLGIYNTHLALILPGWISTFGTFLLRQYFSSLPGELFEAGRIDGASEFTLFLRIAVPLITAGITAFTVLTFVWSWNDYENPLMFLTNRPLFTIPLGIMEFKGEKNSGIGFIMAGSVLALIPIFTVFVAAQRYFVEGVSTTGIKG